MPLGGQKLPQLETQDSKNNNLEKDSVIGVYMSAPKSKIKWAGYNSNNSKEIKQATFKIT